MTFKTALVSAAFSAAILLGGGAVAAPISPTFASFGTLAGATFGGSGIPNTAVAIATSTGDLTLGLTAHQRLVGPNLANDGLGTFTAFTGVSTGPPSSLADPYATWNFGFYLGGLDISDLRFVLEYDFIAAAGNDASTHGTISVAGIFVPTNPSQDSYNLGMDFLAATNPALGIVAPGGIFNPNAVGEYTFRLTAFGGANNAIAAQTAIRVNVVDQQQVPEPASLALVGMALLGAAAARRRVR